MAKKGERVLRALQSECPHGRAQDSDDEGGGGAGLGGATAEKAAASKKKGKISFMPRMGSRKTDGPTPEELGRNVIADAALLTPAHWAQQIQVPGVLVRLCGLSFGLEQLQLAQKTLLEKINKDDAQSAASAAKTEAAQPKGRGGSNGSGRFGADAAEAEPVAELLLGEDLRRPLAEGLECCSEEHEAAGNAVCAFLGARIAYGELREELFEQLYFESPANAQAGAPVPSLAGLLRQEGEGLRDLVAQVPTRFGARLGAEICANLTQAWCIVVLDYMRRGLVTLAGGPGSPVGPVAERGGAKGGIDAAVLDRDVYALGWFFDQVAEAASSNGDQVTEAEGLTRRLKELKEVTGQLQLIVDSGTVEGLQEFACRVLADEADAATAGEPSPPASPRPGTSLGTRMRRWPRCRRPHPATGARRWPRCSPSRRRQRCLRCLRCPRRPRRRVAGRAPSSGASRRRGTRSASPRPRTRRESAAAAP